MGLSGALYAEFDPIAGPKSLAQYPNNVLDADSFEDFSDYMITPDSLAGRLLAINTGDFILVGCPSVIYDPKYPRNQLMFNVVLVFTPDSNTLPFHNTVCKLSADMRAMEIETAQLSSHPTREKLLEVMLSYVVVGLRSTGSCAAPFGELRRFHLRISTPDQNAPSVGRHDVPVLSKLPSTSELAMFDLSIQQIIPFVNGVRCVDAIAIKSRMPLSLVKVVIAGLCVAGIVVIIDAFQFRNQYMCTNAVTDALKPEAQVALQIYAASSSTRRPAFFPMFRFLCAMRMSASVGHLARALKITENGADVRRLIAFAISQGWIARVRHMPVRLSEQPGPTSQHKEMMTGTRSLDNLACRLNQTVADVEAIVRSDQHTVLLDVVQRRVSGGFL